MPYWINVTGRSKGQVFMCSECKETCNCIGTGNASKYRYNFCNYRFCPRCGMEMDLQRQTILVRVEKRISGKENE